MSDPQTGINSSELFSFDRNLKDEKGIVSLTGVDEAGRGPLAGPVVAASVILDTENIIEGINDSKKLNAQTREKLFPVIKEKAICWSIGVATVEEIDSMNILQATFTAMTRAVNSLSTAWDFLLVDGTMCIPSIAADSQRAVRGGDARSASIAAASIIAKVTRDRIMKSIHEQYPRYGFDENKGYGTAAHIEKIGTCGLSPVHRRTFCNHLFIQTKLDLEVG